MLLYLVVKNHAFTDGNKRIAAACFLMFLQRNNILTDEFAHPIISNEALASKYFHHVKTQVFASFFFPFPSLKFSTVALAMLENFALVKKKINFPKISAFHIAEV